MPVRVIFVQFLYGVVWSIIGNFLFWVVGGRVNCTDRWVFDYITSASSVITINVSLRIGLLINLCRYFAMFYIIAWICVVVYYTISRRRFAIRFINAIGDEYDVMAFRIFFKNARRTLYVCQVMRAPIYEDYGDCSDFRCQYSFARKRWYVMASVTPSPCASAIAVCVK